MKEIDKNIRKLVIDTLMLLSSREMQLKYQKDVPYADVSAELFCQWDGAFIPDNPHNMNAFSEDEVKYLNEFNVIFNRICDNTPNDLPTIEIFIKSMEWKELSEFAALTLKKCKFKTHKD